MVWGVVFVWQLMKPVRLFLFGAAALLVLALLAVAVGLNSSLQTWAARKALAARPSLRAKLGSLAFGFSRVEIGQLRFESHGAVGTLPSLAVELPVLSALFGHNVQVRHLRARGWTLDLTHAPSAAATVAGTPGAPAAAAAAAVPLVQGAFAQLQLPADVTIDDVDLEGEVILPALPDHPAARVKVTLRGGSLATGRDGRFALEIAGTTEDGGTLTLHGEISAFMDTPRTFGRLVMTTDAAVSGPRFPQRVKLKTQVVAARTAGGETYHWVLSGEGKKLADVQADFASVGAKITGQWKIDLRASDLAPFTLGHVLPEFAAVGEGSFETDASFGEVHAAGRLKVYADHLAVVRPEFAAIGAITVLADFDVLQHASSVRVDRLSATVAGTKPVLRVHALQSFELNLRTGGLSVADPAQDLLWLSLQDVPLAWARPFLGNLAVTGDDVRGEFAASAHAGGLTLHSKAPLSVKHLGVTRAGVPLLNDVDVAASLAGDYSPQGWQMCVTDFAARRGGETLLTLELKAGQLAGKDQPVKAAGHWNANLPAALAQPAATGHLQLASGTADGELTASLTAADQQLQATVKITNLVAANKETLPVVTGDLRADVDRTGKITFNAALQIERATRKSDLLVAGTLTRAAGGVALNARLASDLLVAADVQLLAAPLAASPSLADTDGAPTSPDLVPFWQDLRGQIVLALKKVVYSEQFQISDVGGVLRVGEGELRLEGLRAGFGDDSDLKLNAGVAFTPHTVAPYRLSADLALLNFDVAPAFKALAPEMLPTIEGRINLTSLISGDGGNLTDLAARARGDTVLSSKGGLFRALSSDISDKIQRTQSTVAAIGGLLGVVTRKQEFENLNNKAQILTDIAKALSEIPFDQLSVIAARDASLNVVLKDFTLISPEVRLGGSGQITHVTGVPLLAQPLKLELTLAARGRLGDLMKRAGLLENKQDSLGYAAFVAPLIIGGTLGKTDTSELRNALLNSALEKSGLLNTLLGK